MNHLPYLLIVLFLLPYTFQSSAEAIPHTTGKPECITYISPLPGSGMNSTGANIILRFHPSFNDFLPGVSVQVTGNAGREVIGETMVFPDIHTLVFEPSEPFIPGEVITVTVFEHTGTMTAYRYGFKLSNYGIGEVTLPENFRQGKPEVMERPAAQSHAHRPGTGGQLPDDFPEIAITISDNPPHGYYFLGASANSTTKDTYNTILDTAGIPVFYHKSNNASADFKLQANGYLTSMDYNLSYFQELDSSYRIRRFIQAGNGYFTDTHELLVLEDDSYWILAIDPQPVDMSQIVPGGNPNALAVGAVIQHITAGGTVVFQWRSFDHFQITDTDTNFVDLTGNYIDYVHANALSIDFDGNVLMSSRHLNEITKVSTTTGNVIWRMGGNANQFTFINDPHGFGGQHSIYYNGENSYTLFNNGNFLNPEKSNGMEYAIDHNNLTATLINEYNIDEVLVFADAMGHMQRLDDGNSIIGWAANPENFVLSEYNASGERIFEIKRVDLGLVSYRAFKFDWETNAFYFTADSIDFGEEVTIGDSAIVGAIVYNNYGEPIEINGYHTHNEVFTLNTTLPVTIQEGATHTFNVRFKPEEEISYVDVLTLFFDRGDTSRIANQVKLTGGGMQVGLPSLTAAQEPLKVFPNPAGSTSRVALTNGQQIDRLEVVGLDGQVILKREVNAASSILETDNLASGVYLIRVYSDTEAFVGKWLIK
jgi:hypothetical protein